MPLGGAAAEQQQVALGVAQQQQQQQQQGQALPQQPAEGAAAAAAAAAQQQLPQQQEQQPQGQLDEKFLCAGKEAADLPVLKIEHVLRSNKPRQPTDVTLVTQLSFERWGAGGRRGGAGA